MTKLTIRLIGLLLLLLLLLLCSHLTERTSRKDPRIEDVSDLV